MALVCSTMLVECLFFKDISEMTNMMGGGIAISIQVSIEMDSTMAMVFYRRVMYTMRDIFIKDFLMEKEFILMVHK